MTIMVEIHWIILNPISTNCPKVHRERTLAVGTINLEEVIDAPEKQKEWISQPLLLNWKTWEMFKMIQDHERLSWTMEKLISELDHLEERIHTGVTSLAHAMLSSHAAGF